MIALAINTKIAEHLEDAYEEIKRADHLIFVSLKYTRTVDVLKSIIERLVNTFDHGITVLLDHAKENKKIAAVPELPRLKIDAVRTIYGTDQNIIHYLELYFLLKRIDKARFERAQEYRRHVTMTAHLTEGDHIEITIDIISDYFDKTKEFIKYIEKNIMKKEE